MLFDKFEHEERFIAAFERFVAAQELMAAKMAWPLATTQTTQTIPYQWSVPPNAPIYTVPVNASAGVTVPNQLPGNAFVDLTEGRPMRVGSGG